MATEIIMPKVGIDMEEGTIIKWLKNVGESVNEGEPLLEILTDKVNMEIEAELSGTLLHVCAKEGEVLPVFTVIGYIGKPGEDVPIKQQMVDIQLTETLDSISIENQQISVTEKEMLENQKSKYRATPAARKLAKDKNILISDISGSGPLGRVQRIDVEDYNRLEATPLITNIEEEQDNIIPMIGLRKIIAERMKDSLNKSAPATLTIEVDMTNALNLIKKLKPIIQKEIEKKITVTDLIIMATSKSLMQYPMVNATLVDAGIQINDHVNMGIAVGLEKGLLVPVIEAADKMTLREIVSIRTDIVQRVLENKIPPDELRGSTFTISNLGMFNIVSFTSIINQPNSAILSIGTARKRMRIIIDEPQIRSVMNLSLTIDHRIIDGLYGAQFLQYLKDLLEDPTLLLL